MPVMTARSDSGHAPDRRRSQTPKMDIRDVVQLALDTDQRGGRRIEGRSLISLVREMRRCTKPPSRIKRVL